MINKNNWDKEKLLSSISKSDCKADILRNLNLSINSGNYRTLSRYCIKYDIDITNIDGKSVKYINKFKNRKLSNTNDVFIKNSIVSSTVIRKRIKQDNLIVYNCSLCDNNGSWLNSKLTLQLDHINGDSFDNRLENLQYLCPNCHSQTATYGSKNKKKR